MLHETCHVGIHNNMRELTRRIGAANIRIEGEPTDISKSIGVLLNKRRVRFVQVIVCDPVPPSAPVPGDDPIIVCIDRLNIGPLGKERPILM